VSKEQLRIDLIRLDGGAQSRAKLDETLICEYAAEMLGGTEFAPVVVYHDGADYWLSDGFHRVRAALKAEAVEIAAEIRQGALRDAILHSVGANADHGLRRTNEDKRRAVAKLLGDEEWRAWSNREIARRCCVSEFFVRSLRLNRSEKPVYVTKHGTSASMDASNIGRAGPGPLGPTGHTIVSKAEYEGIDRQPAPRPKRPRGGIASDAFTPVRGHSRPKPMVPLSLPPGNAEMAANTLIELFDEPWLAELADRIAVHLKKGDQDK